MLAGIEETLSAAGYVLVMITHHYREEVLQQSERIFAERAVDAVILVGTTLQFFGTTPTVTVSCPDEHPHVTNIVLDHAKAAAVALQHLYALGHRNLAVIKGYTKSSDTEVRWRSIARAAAELGMTLPPERVVQLDEEQQTNEPGYRAMRKLLQQNREFSAVFAFNDVAAIGAIDALRDAGLDVPEDVSVMGFDDVAYARVHRPSLTTVRQPLHQMGVLAANAVLEQLHTPAGGAHLRRAGGGGARTDCAFDDAKRHAVRRCGSGLAPGQETCRLRVRRAPGSRIPQQVSDGLSRALFLGWSHDSSERHLPRCTRGTPPEEA